MLRPSILVFFVQEYSLKDMILERLVLINRKGKRLFRNQRRGTDLRKLKLKCGTIERHFQLASICRYLHGRSPVNADIRKVDLFLTFLM